MKRALIAIPVVLVTLLALLLAAPGFMDWNKYKEPAIAQIRKTTGLEVALNGDLSLALIPSPRFHIENVVVKAPTGSSSENLATMERLNVNVALMPLLAGQVGVDSLDLIKPDITLETLKSGEANWMTPELKAMSENKAAGANPGQAAQISLDNVKITNGSFRFLNAQTGQKSEISGINVDVEAETLQGPFELDGTFAFAGQDIEFEAKTGKMEPGAQSIALKGTAEMPKSGMNVDYAGVVGIVAPFEVQGETAVKMASLADTMAAYGVKNNPFKSNEASLTGIITASQEKFAIDNGVLTLGGQKFAADVKATLKPEIALVSSFKAQESVNLDAFMGQKAQSKSNESAGLAGVSELVPQTISLPMDFDASIEIVLPSATYQGQVYNDLTLAFVKKDKQFQGKVVAANIPGKGKADAGAALEYASQSKGEKAGIVFSEPSLSVFLKGESQNVAQSVAALTGRSDLAYINKIKAGSVDLKAAVSPKKLELTDSVARFDGAVFNIAGSFMPDGTNGRPALAIDISTDTLDIDKWKTKSGEGQTEQKAENLSTTLKALALPYDVSFDIGIQNAKLEGQDIKGLRAQGAITRNAAKIENLSAQNFAGTAMILKGQVADIQNLSGVDFSVTADSQNIKTFAQTLGVKTESWPKGLAAAKITASGKGTASAMAMSADIAAMGGSVTAKGDVADPLGTPQVSNIAFQAKHPNTAQAVKIFAPDAPDYASMNKPLDISANIKQQGKVYSLENLKAVVAGSNVDGSLSFDTGAAKPTLNGDLKFGDLVIQSGKTQAASTSSGGGGSAAPAKSGQWSSDVIDSGFLHSANASVTVTANSIKYEGWDMQKPVLKLKLLDGTLDVQQLEAGLFGGQMAIAATVQSPSPKAPITIRNSSKFTNVNIESMAKALSTTSKVQGKGAVDMAWDINTTGVSQLGLVSSLKGSSTLKGRQLVLEGFDLAALATALMDSNKPLPRLQEIVSASTSGGQTAFDALDGQYAINNGIVTITSMAMDGPAATINSLGTVSLPQWFIDSTHKITLKNAREVAPFNVVIKGPLNNPGNTFGKGMFDSILRSKVQEKVMEKLPDLLGDSASEKLQKFGILPGKAAQPAPAQPAPVVPAVPGEVPPAEVVPSGGEEAAVPPPAETLQPPAAEEAPPEEVTPEKAFQGLLENLIEQ